MIRLTLHKLFTFHFSLQGTKPSENNDASHITLDKDPIQLDCKKCPLRASKSSIPTAAVKRKRPTTVALTQALTRREKPSLHNTRLNSPVDEFSLRTKRTLTNKVAADLNLPLREEQNTNPHMIKELKVKLSPVVKDSQIVESPASHVSTDSQSVVDSKPLSPALTNELKSADAIVTEELKTAVNSTVMTAECKPLRNSIIKNPAVNSDPMATKMTYTVKSSTVKYSVKITAPQASRLKCPVCDCATGCGTFLCMVCAWWVHPKCGGYTAVQVQNAGKTDAKNSLVCNNCKEVLALFLVADKFF